MTEPIQQRQIVVFTLGGEHYGLPIGEVQEIIRYTEPRSVASQTDWLRGVISLRGQIVPVYDVAVRLGVSARPDAEAKIVIVEAGGETAGVIVDGVDEVLTISSDQAAAVPGADSSMLESIVRVDDRLIVMLTLSTIFAAPDLATAA